MRRGIAVGGAIAGAALVYAVVDGWRSRVTGGVQSTSANARLSPGGIVDPAQFMSQSRGEQALPQARRHGRALRFSRAGFAVINTAALLVTAGGIYFLVQSRDAENKANKLDSRETLASQYGSMEDREFEDPLYLTLFESQEGGVSPEQWISQTLRRTAPSVNFSGVRSVDDLDQLIWTQPSERSPAEQKEVDRLRQLGLHAEGYLNFLSNVAEYEERDIITSDEADSWYVIVDIGNFACHPVVLQELLFVHEYRFLTTRVAQEIQVSLDKNRNPFCHEVAKLFYPDVLDPTWVP